MKEYHYVNEFIYFRKNGGDCGRRQDWGKKLKVSSKFRTNRPGINRPVDKRMEVRIKGKLVED